MRKRIDELACGRVWCLAPIIEFSVNRIEITVPEGREYMGEFTITAINKTAVRGMVYSSDSRMECLTPRFEGEEVRILYKFHSAGLMEGDILKGDFFIVCNQGEYNLSFVVLISKLYAAGESGEIHGLRDFARLAQTNYQEAEKIFYSPCFIHILKHTEVSERLLYNGLAKGRPTDHNLEEFLLGCKLKEKIILEADQTEFQFYHVMDTLRGSVTLKKNTWGYVEFSIESDADFIEPEKKWMTTEDFLGSTVESGFYINPQKMHRGRNYGYLTIKNIYQEIVISVCATYEDEGNAHDPLRKKKKQLHAKILRSYIDYRLKKTVTGKWASATCKDLDGLIAMDTDNMWYRLMKAQTFFVNGQRQEAEWILSDFKRRWKDQRSPEWAYYMYICTLMEHEELYINRLYGAIEQVYLEHKENTMLFWCMLFLKEEYAKNRYQKLRALEERIMSGVKSPLLYVEVYCLYMQEPYLLNQLGEFEWEILNWARKQKILNTALAEQVVSVFPERLSYQRLHLLLLEACYELVGEDEILPVICGYLIRNQKYGKRFFIWYEKGIEQRLCITGLYEAYLLSMDARSVQEVPRIIQMYFKYNTQLGYRQKAVLYVNMIAAKVKQPELYEQYYPAMEKFAYEQMEQKHMDDNLAVIYEDILSHGVYSTQLSGVLSDVLFIHKLTCFAPKAASVVILQKQLEHPIVVPLVSGVAYFPLYSNDYSVFIEDSNGNRYSGSISWQLEKLMYPGRYLRICMKNAPGKLPYLLYYFANREAQEIFEEKDLPYFQAIMTAEEVSLSYKAWLFPKMFYLLSKLEQVKEMEKQLKGVEISLMMPKARGSVLELCVENRLYEQAYQIVLEYGFEQLSPSAKVLLLSDRIRRIDFAEDENLLQYCADVFIEGKYNDVLLEYLCRYYNGATKVMTAVFKSADSFGIDTWALSERIVVQMLYTNEFVDCADRIYNCYKTKGSGRIKEAYLSYFSYYSFTKDVIAPEGFFLDLETFYEEGSKVNMICELALLKHYALAVLLTEKQKKNAEILLKKYLLEGIRFAFYKEFPEKILLKYQLKDKYYIEYHAQKNSRIQLHYKLLEENSDYLTEEMAEMYDGVFVKEMILFFGDAIQYYITEEIDGQMEVTESDQITCSEVYEEAGGSRYERLNEIILLQTTADMEGLADKMQEYEQLEELTKVLFTTL